MKMSFDESALSSNELLLRLENFLVNGGYLILGLKFCDGNLKSFIKIDIKKNTNEIHLFVNIRNISSAYLPNKPYIKRRQVGKLILEEIPKNENNSLTMLLGVAKIGDSFVLACWNPFYFVGHATNRSCYVLEDSMTTAICEGLYDGVDCKTPVLVCSENRFSDLLEIYKERNVVE